MVKVFWSISFMLYVLFVWELEQSQFKKEHCDSEVNVQKDIVICNVPIHDWTSTSKFRFIGVHWPLLRPQSL
ncbi:hypothetical protein CEXT_755451 [Caerostris extrusa]|uniref:Uncharacterized protein n=1 Tax=Caerostris extrusa TaxID=172846 RepID=A0AAV4ND75_CAEEX|nr:hypothetical protein CEXT_755451 [Caerostris extrusa]